MDADEQLAKQVQEYQSLAQENPNINVGMLMMNALSSQKQNLVSIKSKRWAYTISLGAPPFGFLFALKYYAFSDEDDAKQVAWTCIILTVVSVLMFWLASKLLLSGSGTSLQQIQQIKPSDIQQLGQ